MKRLALFIGINSYAGSPLSCSCADAEALHREFAGRYDVVKLLTDRQATPGNIAEAIAAIRRQARAGDMFVFFFSGHGHDSGGERLMSIPERDSRGRPRGGGWLSTETLRKETDVRGLHRLFILDCCRVRAKGKRAIPEFSPPIAKASGFIERHGRRSVVRPTLLSSTSPGQVSYENPARGYSYFTEAILEALRDKRVRNFNQFRDRLDSIMAAQDKPGDQEPYFEGPIGADLPFWPAWNEEEPEEDASDFAEDVADVGEEDSASGEEIVDFIDADEFEEEEPGDEPPRLSNRRDHLRPGKRRGTWEPEPGYVWRHTNSDSPRSAGRVTAVEWKPRRPLRGCPHVVAGRREGEWMAAPGWRLSESSGPGGGRRGDYYEWWAEGKPFSKDNPNVLASHHPDWWVPRPGFVWARSATDELRPKENIDAVEWVPHRPMRGYPHLFSGQRSGEWNIEPGWALIGGVINRFTPDGNDDFRTHWVPGTPFGSQYPHVVAARKPDYWMPAPGYVWTETRDNAPVRVTQLLGHASVRRRG